MAENRGLSPLLVYGVLVAIIAARRTRTDGTSGSEDSKTRHKSYRTVPVPTESSGSLANLVWRRRSMLTTAEGTIENDQPISAQLRRAKESGRERHATAQSHVPWTGWKDIFSRVYASVNDNRLLAVAARDVFCSLLAIFPAVSAFVSLYGLIADASTIDAHLSLASGIFPAGAVDVSTIRSRSSRQRAMQSSASDSWPGSAWPSGAPTPE